MLVTVVCRSLGDTDVNPCDEIVGSRFVLGEVSDGVLSLDCVVIVDELVMEVLLIFALEYVAKAI